MVQIQRGKKRLNSRIHLKGQVLVSEGHCGFNLSQKVTRFWLFGTRTFCLVVGENDPDHIVGESR